jgi:3-methyl-2-oxobutanoate hydroxymethyltransferase
MVGHGLPTHNSRPNDLSRILSGKSNQALVVVDLPLKYQSDPKKPLPLIRIMKESGGHAVKLEGGN